MRKAFWSVQSQGVQSVLIWLAFSLVYASLMLCERFPVSNRDMDLISGLIGCIDVFWLGLIWFVVRLSCDSCGTMWRIHIDVEAQKQPSSTPPHSDMETLKHLQDLGFVWVGSVPQCNAIGRLLGGPRADWSSVGGRGRGQPGQVSADWPLRLSVLVRLVLYLVSVPWVTARRWADGKRISGRETEDNLFKSTHTQKKTYSHKR